MATAKAAAAGAAAAAELAPEPASAFQSHRTKVAVIWSFVVTILLALPVWWKTTSIERLALPRDDLARWRGAGPQDQQLQQQACAFELPIRLQLSLDDALLQEIAPRPDDAAGTLRALNAFSNEACAQLSRQAGAALRAQGSPSCLRFDVSTASSAAHVAAVSVLERARLEELERWHAAKRAAEQARAEAQAQRAARRAARKAEQSEWRAAASLPPEAPGALHADELRKRLDAHAALEDAEIQQEKKEAQAYAAFAAPPAHLLASHADAQRKPAFSALDYSIHLHSDADAEGEDQAGAYDLLLPTSAGSSGAAASSELAADLSEGFLDAFPLACLTAPASASASAGRKCASPAGVASGKAIQYERRVELVFSLVHQDASDGGAFTDWDIASLLQGKPAGQGQSSTPERSTGRRLSAASATSDSAAPALTDVLRDLSERSVHDFKIETQMLFYAPLAFQPHKHVTTTPKISYMQVEREVEVEIEDEEVERQQEQEVDAALGGAGEEQADNEASPVDSPASTPAEPEERRPRFRKEMRKFMQEIRSETVKEDYVIDFEDLKIFVNAGEWNLGASTPSLPREIRQQQELAQDPAADAGDALTVAEAGDEPRTLHFLLFVPAKRHTPLRIRDPATGNFSASRSWVVPQWGGVVLLDRESVAPSSEDISGTLPQQALTETAALWNVHLRSLLGLPRAARAHAVTDGPTSPFEADLLGVSRIQENIQNAVDTLDSIVKLVDKLPNLGVDKTVQADFRKSVASLKKIEQKLRSAAAERQSTTQRGLVELLQLSSDAAIYASRSFFNPSMIAQLYFPDEHKYAVYTPLFGPVSVPIVVGLLQLLKERAQRRRRARRVGAAQPVTEERKRQ